MVTALYPGTFDPVTNGHVDITSRAAKLFEQIIVAVYDTPPKSNIVFSTQERVDLFQESVKHLKNVKVQPFKGLVVHAARAVGAHVMLRGLRANPDFEYEFEMAMMNKRLAPDIESVYLMSSLESQFISASRVKEVVQLGGDVTNLVPDHVVQMLRARLQRGG
ncbi:MAG: pantetheine-phosphate adenylyltransferase [Dehalococcoidia bacterium]|nr:pantetheine-phosphate adenylyltransferase [Dehalococcoidia bacterium]